MTPEEAADKLEIIELCTVKHWIYDHDNWPEYDDVFTDPVAFAGAATVDPDSDSYLSDHLITREELKLALQGFKAGLTTQHLITGHRVQIDGDTAVCRAHSINVHLPTGTAMNDAVLAKGNDYRFDCIRTVAGWRIRGFIGTTRWTWGNPESHNADAKMRAWRDARE